ncbi:MAG: hypothetical protein CL862_06500 [Cyanobium sp. NAT70]|nr:hypothetical protein [Cyanobium sp. NAT70]
MQVPTVHLDDDLLVYRVDNGRLLAALQEHFGAQQTRLKRLHKKEAEADTQELLHRLLVDKAADPRGPILRELKRLAVQTEPLLVDCSGVVVNGNRRLSAMRQLFREDPKRFKRFKRPLVAVLPQQVSRSDVEYIETALQLAPETKLPYGWVDRRLKLRRQIEDLGLEPDWVQEAYRLDSRQQLDNELAELELVEIYLKDVIKTPFQYSAVAPCERLFQRLQAQLCDLPKELVKPWQTIGLLLISQRRHLAPTMDRQFPFELPVTDAMPTMVLKRVAEEAQWIESRVDQTLRRRQLKQIAERVLLTQEPRELARSIETLIEEVRQQLKQERVPHRVLHHLQVSKRLLEKLTPDQLNNDERFQLNGEAMAIKSRLDFLLGETKATTSTKTVQYWWRLQRRVSRIFSGSRKKGDKSAKG